MPAAARILRHFERQRRQPTRAARAQQTQPQRPQHIAAIRFTAMSAHDASPSDVWRNTGEPLARGYSDT
jgi:hypothetical protein